MKSSSGAHFIALDHIRALAAFMVVAWHFTHGMTGYPVPFNFAPVVFPLALLDEGHTGVALFMALSGYLFSKLLNGKAIHFPAFFWNRILRLLPLLLLVIMLVAIKAYIDGDNMTVYWWSIAKGVVSPTLPNGGWSITVEFHFYALLPILLWMFRKSKLLPVLVVISAILIRAVIYQTKGQVQSYAYLTIVGRLDQFVLGMLAFHFRSICIRRHWMAAATILLFSVFYWYFDRIGGWFSNPRFPSPNPIWIFMPTIEGGVYAFLIAWYDNSFEHSTSTVSQFIGRMGEYSYSIYLLHVFAVHEAAHFVNERIMPISNFYLATLWALAFYLLMFPVGYLSFRFIEAPFLELRKRYIISSQTKSV